jgi:hypothetical protein
MGKAIAYLAKDQRRNMPLFNFTNWSVRSVCRAGFFG